MTTWGTGYINLPLCREGNLGQSALSKLGILQACLGYERDQENFALSSESYKEGCFSWG